MDKTYGFLVTHTINVHYEVGGKDEEDARKALDNLLDEGDLDLADFDISDTEITCLGEIKPSYRVYFDGQNLIGNLMIGLNPRAEHGCSPSG